MAGGHRQPADRGQTLQDYVIGISIFVLVAFLALGFFPGLLQDFQSGSVGDHEAQADRIGRQIVTNNSIAGTDNRLNATAIEVMMDQSEDDLRQRFGVNDTVNLNITVESLDGDYYVNDTRTLASQPNYYGRSAGTSARIVTLSDDGYGCSPACRLVVRAW